MLEIAASVLLLAACVLLGRALRLLIGGPADAAILEQSGVAGGRVVAWEG